MTNDIRLPINDADNPKTKAGTPAGGLTSKDDKIMMMNPFAILTSGSRYNKKRATAYGSGWTRSIVHTGKGGGGHSNSGHEHEHELRDLERYGSRERMVINQTRTTEVTSEPRGSDQEEEAKVAEGSMPPSVVMISAGGPIPQARYGP